MRVEQTVRSGINNRVLGNLSGKTVVKFDPTAASAY